MSETETVDDTLAFEYVAGSLQGSERDSFQARLNKDSPLAARVAYWEQQLSALYANETPLPPLAGTWSAIEERLAPETHLQTPRKTSSGGWFKSLAWAFGGALASLMLTVGLWNMLPHPMQSPGTTLDYIAVLTSSTGDPVLTTLGNAASSKLTLSWEESGINDDSDYQLWAVSRRDGQTRSLAVFDNDKTAGLTLEKAQWRLIVDAKTLLLTREEPGGSAIDEPSEQLVASGVCVRLRASDARS